MGYQCANFYRQLIENNEIQDDRYVVDESGKAHYLFSKGIIKKGKNKLAPGESDGDALGGADAAVVDADGQPLTSSDGSAKPPAKKKRKLDVKTAATSSSSAPVVASASADADPMEGVALTATTLAPAAAGAAAIPAEPKKKAAKRTGNGKKAGNKKKRKKPVDDDADSGDDDYKPSSKTVDALNEEVEANKVKLREENPLPEMRDAITQEELLQPAISPYGHVLSYSTWMTILLKDPKNTCPFTKQPLKKRDLVVLTWDNISEYQDKIMQAQ